MAQSSRTLIICKAPDSQALYRSLRSCSSGRVSGSGDNSSGRYTSVAWHAATIRILRNSSAGVTRIRGTPVAVATRTENACTGAVRPRVATFPWKAGVTFAAWCAAGDVHKWFIACVGYVARNEHDHSAVAPVTTVSTRSSIAALATITATSAFLAILAGATNSTAATLLSVATSPAPSASAAFG